MRAVDDLKERVEGGVRSRLSMNSDGSRGIAQLVQSRANGQGHSVECCGIGRFAKTWGELVFFEQFFDLLLREHPRAGIFDTRERAPHRSEKEEPRVPGAERLENRARFAGVPPREWRQTSRAC